MLGCSINRTRVFDLHDHGTYTSLNVDPRGGSASRPPTLRAVRAALPACIITTSAATSRFLVGSTLPRPSSNRDPKDQAGLGGVCGLRYAKTLKNACCGIARVRFSGCGRCRRRLALDVVGDSGKAGRGLSRFGFGLPSLDGIGFRRTAMSRLRSSVE